MARPASVPIEARSGILTTEAACRLDVSSLAGQVVWYTLRNTDVKIAEHVWDNSGRYIGGLVAGLCKD